MKLHLLAVTVASVALPSGASAGIIGSLRGKFDGQVAEEKARQASGSAINLSFLSDAEPRKRACQRERKDLEFCGDVVTFSVCKNCLASVDEGGRKFTSCETATPYYCSETAGTVAKCAVGGACGAECADALNAFVSCSLEEDGCDGCPADQATNEIQSSSHFAYTMNRLAPSAVASFLAALSEHGALKGGDRPELAADLGSGDSKKEEPNCDEDWAALGMCISQNDEEGAEACDKCYAGLVQGIDWKGDLCAQLEDEAATDADWCPKAGDCLEGCGKTIEATTQACETAWEGILECSGLSEEEIMGELQNDPCPDLCEEDGFAIAMN